jgi:CheY-like chemotaxis protein
MIPIKCEILLVEDDENDVYFMTRAMEQAGLQPPIHVAINGQDAVDYLSGTSSFTGQSAFPPPRCIFLDLKLPFLSGFQVLEWMRGQPKLKDITVFVLTSSPEDSDRQRARKLGAKAYLVKPPTAQMLLDVLKHIPESLPIHGTAAAPLS